MMIDLTHALAGWQPGPVTAVDRIDPWATAAFAALLDQPHDIGAGDVLPPLWHWFSGHDLHRRAELGEDGHPADAAFLPPVPHRRRMFAGGRVRWHGQVRVGDEVERRSSVRRVAVKHGRTGQLAFVTVAHELHRYGRLLVDEEQDLVYRSQPAGAPRAVAHQQDAAPPAGRTRFEFDTDPVTLFQFSALTYNAHRIHYDHRYVTEVEGYPGLVVHGPLLALLLLEVPRRDGRAVGWFTYRLTRTVFAGTRLAVTQGPSGELYAGAVDGPAAVNGAVTEEA